MSPGELLQFNAQSICGQGPASPQAHHQPGSKEQTPNQQPSHEQELTRIRLQKNGEREQLQEVGKYGNEEPGQQNGSTEGQVLPFPLLVQRPDGTVVLRTCLSADFSRGSMIFAGSIPRGAQVRFSSSFGYETIEKSIRDITSFHSTRPDADLVIAFSCMARHWAAGTLVGDEIAAALRLWKKPLVGFFTYGEIGQGHTGQCDFHNESLCLVLLTVNPPTP